jgi:hypothetical protein
MKFFIEVPGAPSPDFRTWEDPSHPPVLDFILKPRVGKVYPPSIPAGLVRYRQTGEKLRSMHRNLGSPKFDTCPFAPARAALVQSPTVTQMAMFVHLTSESRIARIRRNGIARLHKAVGTSPEGVYAVPVAPNFYASHQWLRELKRRNQGPIAGVYFRIPD